MKILYFVCDVWCWSEKEDEMKTVSNAHLQLSSLRWSANCFNVRLYKDNQALTDVLTLWLDPPPLESSFRYTYDKALNSFEIPFLTFVISDIDQKKRWNENKTIIKFCPKIIALIKGGKRNIFIPQRFVWFSRQIHIKPT